VKVAGVVVTHGPQPGLDRSLAALAPQVDELLVVANPPAPKVDARLLVNDRALGFAPNANKGIAETSAPFVIVANPDTEPRPGAVELLRKFAEIHPRAGVV
jgi:GT2 family glycosyltransferase